MLISSSDPHDAIPHAWTEFARSRQEHHDAIDTFERLMRLRRSGTFVPMQEVEQAIDRLDASFRRMKAAASVVLGQDCNIDYGVPALNPVVRVGAPGWRGRRGASGIEVLARKGAASNARPATR